jgi:hypothetical protein
VSSHRDALAYRRQALVAQSDQDRAALAAVFGGLERRFAIAEVALSTARRINRHWVLVGAVAVGLIFVPRSARKWVRRAMGLWPLVAAGYRLFKRRDA